MKILALEPYFGGSHRAFLEGLAQNSCHEWTLLTGPAVHWKWRMRCSPLDFAEKVSQHIERAGLPDAILCSDMLDVPGWLGCMAAQNRLTEICQLPIVTYFHESQWTYPTSPHARVDFHYGYTNLLTALTSRENWFNSNHHLSCFLEHSESFVRRMPDSKSVHDFQLLRDKCHVFPPGFEPPRDLPPRNEANPELTIGWVSRWEYDKRPDLFLRLLETLVERGVAFRLVLLGGRQESCAELQAVRAKFQHLISVDQYAEDRDSYWQSLGKMDVVVSTADHEFFGIAVCEAIHAGAVPVLPNRLSYPELVPNEFLYETIDEAASQIQELQDEHVRRGRASIAKANIQPLQLSGTANAIDQAFLRLAKR